MEWLLASCASLAESRLRRQRAIDAELGRGVSTLHPASLANVFALLSACDASSTAHEAPAVPACEIPALQSNQVQ